jgi:hypothetical protein
MLNLYHRIVYSLVTRYASTWSHSLRELLYHGKPEEVLKEYYHRQPSLSSLSVQTYCIIFKAFTLTKNWSEGQKLYDQIRINRKFKNDQRLKIARKIKINISLS